MSHSHCHHWIAIMLFVCLLTGAAFPSQSVPASAHEVGVGALRISQSGESNELSISPGSSLPDQQNRITNLAGGALLDNLPLIFVKNQGQVNQQVAFYILGGDTQVFFTNSGVTFVMNQPNTQKTDLSRLAPPSLENDPPTSIADPRFSGTERTAIATNLVKKGVVRWTVKLDFIGSQPVTPVGEVPGTAVVSYFTNSGNRRNTAVPTYQQVAYHQLWPGIDLVFHGQAGQLKYDFIVHPGAQPDRIALQYRGAQDVMQNTFGDLEIKTPLGNLTDTAPSARQAGKKGEQQVPVAFAITENYDRADDHGNQKVYKFGFDIGTYDPTRELVIDPAVVVQCGYVGGAYSDAIRDIDLDGNGNIYITGETQSDQTSFPVMAGPDTIFNGGMDAFVAKVNPTGTALIYAGYIGGSGNEVGWGIAVDGNGNAYVAGETTSAQDTFPVSVGPDLSKGGYYDGFVAKISPAGTSLIYSGFIGGGSDDVAYDVAVDDSGNAYLTGKTASTDFPAIGGPYFSFKGINDAFISKVKSDGTGFVYSGFIGGTDWDWGYRVAVDSAGNAYVAGETKSDTVTDGFPALVGPDLTYNGGWDSFIAKVNPSGTALIYSGYIGGINDELTWGMALDNAGNAYITGETASTETTFPVSVGPDLSYNGGGSDAFVAKVLANGTSLAYCGYIGGDGGDWGYGVAVDGEGNAYIAGTTNSSEGTFPRINGPDWSYNGGGSDAFIAKVDHLGAKVLYSGYIGGAGADYGVAIAMDDDGNTYVAGTTSSDQVTFPVSHWFDLTQNGNYDGFVAKVSVFFGSYLPSLLK